MEEDEGGGKGGNGCPRMAVIRGGLFWEELELRRFLNVGRRLAVDVQGGQGGLEVWKAVVEASRRRLEDLKRSERGFREGIGNPSLVTLGEYERRVRDMEREVVDAEGADRSNGIGRKGGKSNQEELLGLRRRFGEVNSSMSTDKEGVGKQVVDRQRKIQDELTSLLLVKVGEMKRGAEILEGKLRESNHILNEVDDRIDHNLSSVTTVRKGLKDFVRTSFFHSLSMWIFVAFAIIIWIAIVLLLIVVR